MKKTIQRFLATLSIIVSVVPYFVPNASAYTAIDGFAALRDSSSASEIQGVLTDYNLQGYLGMWFYQYYYGAQSSKDSVNQYFLTYRGSIPGDGVQYSDWEPISIIMNAAIANRKAELANIVNSASSPGTCSGGSCTGDIWPVLTDYMAGLGGSDLAWQAPFNTDANRNLLLQYVYDGGRPYADTSAIYSAINGARTYIDNQKYIGYFTTLKTSSDVGTIANTLVDWNLQGKISQYYPMYYGSQESKNSVAQYFIANRGTLAGDGMTQSDWDALNTVVNDGISARKAALLSKINSAPAAGYCAYDPAIWQTTCSGDVWPALSDYMAGLGGSDLAYQQPFNDTANRNILLDTVYNMRPYAQLSDIYTAINAARDAVANQKYVTYFTTMKTSTDVSTIANTIINNDLSGKFNQYYSVYYGSAESKNSVAQYVINNRGALSGNGLAASDWEPVNTLVNQGITERKQLLLDRVNAETSTGTCDPAGNGCTGNIWGSVTDYMMGLGGSDLAWQWPLNTQTNRQYMLNYVIAYRNGNGLYASIQDIGNAINAAKQEAIIGTFTMPSGVARTYSGSTVFSSSLVKTMQQASSVADGVNALRTSGMTNIEVADSSKTADWLATFTQKTKVNAIRIGNFVFKQY